MTLRVLYFGMLGEFSMPPLAALLSAGVDVCGVIVPVTRLADRPPISQRTPDPARSPLPIVNPYLEPNLAHLAWQHGVAVFEVSQLNHPETLATFTALQPDVACVACFPQRIPAAVLALPRLGFLNLHPSLLPEYRGPAPLFWTFRNGENATGVTLHFMDAGLDTGDIARQAPLELPDGISGAQADRLAATLGGQLMVEAVHTLTRGPLPRRQQPVGGSYYPSPSRHDFTLDPTWPARRAFNFMRSTAEWGRPYSIEVDGQRLTLTTALSFSADETLKNPLVRSGNEIYIQFNPGVLRAQ